jgi:hypothetical protein
MPSWARWQVCGVHAKVPIAGSSTGGWPRTCRRDGSSCLAAQYTQLITRSMLLSTMSRAWSSTTYHQHSSNISLVSAKEFLPTCILQRSSCWCTSAASTPCCSQWLGTVSYHHGRQAGVALGWSCRRGNVGCWHPHVAAVARAPAWYALLTWARSHLASCAALGLWRRCCHS